MREAQDKHLDIDKAVEIAPDIFWIGWAEKDGAFRSNPYLIKDGDEVVLVDPGSVPHFPIVLTKVTQVAPLKSITHIILHHQDPDLCSNTPKFEELVYGLGGSLKIVTHSRAWFLIPFYGTRSEYYRVDENGWKLTLKSGRTLRFIFTPYLHFPGAIMTYDEKSKILFSSDVFGGISYDWDLYAKEWYLEAVKAFHENYMAHHDYLKNAMEKLERLDISMICPQHGSIIPGDKAKEYINALKNLECGSFIGESDDMEWLDRRSG